MGHVLCLVSAQNVEPSNRNPKHEVNKGGPSRDFVRPWGTKFRTEGIRLKVYGLGFSP